MAPLKLKIELQNAPVKIIRKVLVPEDINMWQFHLVIQDAMGWLDEHLFEFKDKKWHPRISVMIKDDEFDFGFFHQAEFSNSPEEAGLKKVFVELNESKPFFYWYDFGDDWWHKISFQRVSKKDLALFKGIPVCTEAIGACPPEDVGGVWGYAAFIEAINDKKHPQYAELREWANLEPKEKYDPNVVDIDEINDILKWEVGEEMWNDGPEEFI